MKQQHLRTLGFVLLFSLISFTAQSFVAGKGEAPAMYDWQSALPASPKISSPVKVDQSGRASYSFKIDYPNVLGSVPLSLNYNSGSGHNREMPFGWSVGGLLQISKPVHRKYTDNDWVLSGPVSGQIKRSLSGTTHIYTLYKKSKGEVKVSYDATHNSWTINDNNGRTWTLEAMDLNPVSSLNTTSLWRVTSVSDAKGNTASFQYDPSHKGITDVYFGAHPATGASDVVRIEFEYSPRNDIWNDYSQGFQNQFTHTIDKISIWSNAGTSVYAKLQEYILNNEYTEASAFSSNYDLIGATKDSGRIVLKSIDTFRFNPAQGRSAQSETYYFSYSERKNLPEQQTDFMKFVMGCVNQWPSKTTIPSMFNGCTVSETHSMNHISGSSYKSKPYSITEQKAMLVDLNGDGMLDYAKLDGPSYKVSYLEFDSTTQRFEYRAPRYIHSYDELPFNLWLSEKDSFGNPKTKQFILTTDLNGDGLTDIVSAYEEDYIANGVRNHPSKRWGVYYGVQPNGFQTSVTYEDSPFTSITLQEKGEAYVSQTTRKLIDINRDGWKDILDVEVGQIAVYYHKGSRGAGWDTNPTYLTAPWLTDLNLSPTVIYNHGSLGESVSLEECISINTTNDTCYQITSIQATGLRDINGDGLPDFIVANPAWVGESGNTNIPIPLIDEWNGFDQTDEQATDRNLGMLDFTTTNKWIVYYGTENGWEPKQYWHMLSPQQSFLSNKFHGRPNVSGIPKPLYAHNLSDLIDVDADSKIDLFTNPDYAITSTHAATNVMLPGVGHSNWLPNSLSKFVDEKNVSDIFKFRALDSSIVDRIPYSYGNVNVNRTFQTVADINNDGVLDYVDSVENKVYFGNFQSKPHLMVRVQRHNQMATDIRYKSSNTIYPSGQFNSSDTTNLGGPVVHEVQVSDLITNEKGHYQYDYELPLVLDQYHYGFQFKRTLGATYNGSSSYFNWDFEVEEEHDVIGIFGSHLVKAETRIDPCLSFAPSISSGCTSKPTHPINRAEITYTQKGSDYNLLVPDRIISTEFSEHTTSSFRTLETEIVSNSEGYPTTVKVDGGDGYRNDNNDRLTVYSYKKDATDTIQAVKSISNWGFDPNSRSWRQLKRTEFEYDSQWSLHRKHIYSGYHHGGQNLTDEKMSFTYNRGPRGELLFTIDHQLGSSTSTTYTYGSSRVETQTNALGHTVLYEYDIHGRITKAFYPNGNSMRQVYHPLGYVEETYMTDALGIETLDNRFEHIFSPSTPNYTHTSKYDEHGNLFKESYTVTNGMGAAVQSWTLDRLGNYMVQENAVNIDGLSTQTNRSYTRSMFNPTAGPGAYEQQTQTYFDPLGLARENIADVKAGFAPQILEKPDVGLMKNYDENKYFNLKETDIYGQIITMYQGQGHQTDLTGQYVYDGAGQLVSFIDATNNDNRYFYDGAGRLRKAVGNDFGTREYEYVNGNVSVVTDSTGGRVEKLFDKLGRIETITVTDPLAPSGIQTQTFTYDTNWIGKLSKVDDEMGYKTYEYDSLGRLVFQNRVFQDATGATIYNLTHSREFNRPGSLLNETKPSGRQFEYRYRNGWLERIVEPAENLELVLRYHPVYSGKTIGWSAYQHGMITHSYEKKFGSTILYPDRDSYKLHQPTFPGGMKEVYKRYAFRSNGLLDNTSFYSPYAMTYSKNYEYDHLRRLRGVNTGGGSLSQNENFQYRDATGNIDSLTDPYGDIWNYGPLKGLGLLPNGNIVEQRTHVGTGQNENLGYDKAGRLNYSKDVQTGKEFEYLYYGDSKLRAVQLITPSGPQTILAYNYDDTGKVIVKAYGDPYAPGKRYYNDLGWTYDEASHEMKEYVSIGGQATFLYSNGNREWVFVEHSGSVEMKFNDQGQDLSRVEYSAYGELLGNLTPPTSEKAYHGMPYDRTVGLYEAGLRHMNARLGIFLQPEPVLFSGNIGLLSHDPAKLNSHRFAGNSPTSFGDASGGAAVALASGPQIDAWSVITGTWAEMLSYEFAGEEQKAIIPTLPMAYAIGLQHAAVNTDNVALSTAFMGGAWAYKSLDTLVQPDVSAPGLAMAMIGGPIGNKLGGWIGRTAIRQVDMGALKAAYEFLSDGVKIGEWGWVDVSVLEKLAERPRKFANAVRGSAADYLAKNGDLPESQARNLVKASRTPTPTRAGDSALLETKIAMGIPEQTDLKGLAMYQILVKDVTKFDPNTTLFDLEMNMRFLGEYIEVYRSYMHLNPEIIDIDTFNKYMDMDY